jgi:hypothetical protein
VIHQSRASPPLTLQSLFAIASNSKLFTAVAVGLLIENHTRLPNGELLAWDTKVKDVLPEWQLMDEYASDHVDVVDLLSEWDVGTGADAEICDRACPGTTMRKGERRLRSWCGALAQTRLPCHVCNGAAAPLHPLRPYPGRKAPLPTCVS